MYVHTKSQSTKKGTSQTGIQHTDEDTHQTTSEATVAKTNAEHGDCGKHH